MGFKEFLFRGNLIQLAVAVVIGTAFANVVKALTEVKELLAYLNKMLIFFFFAGNDNPTLGNLRGYAGLQGGDI
jgi:large-conductance mechanosensitive channel